MSAHNGLARAGDRCSDETPISMILSGWHPRRSRRRALLVLGVLIACVPTLLRGQTISSAANQVFHVADGSTTISPITVTDQGGGNIKFNKDIRISIPAGFNMTWDATVLTATITGNAAARTTRRTTGQ